MVRVAIEGIIGLNKSDLFADLSVIRSKREIGQNDYLSCQNSSKKFALTTLPGHCEFGFVSRSMIAQSGSLGTCRALLR